MGEGEIQGEGRRGRRRIDGSWCAAGGRGGEDVVWVVWGGGEEVVWVVWGGGEEVLWVGGEGGEEGVCA